MLLKSMLFGYSKIYVKGRYINRLIRLLNHKHIVIWQLNISDMESFECYILNTSLKEFDKLISKTDCKYKTVKEYGFPYFMRRYKKRIPFVLSMITSFILIYLFTSFIWQIRIYGNDRYNTLDITRTIHNYGIDFGTKKKDINQDKLRLYLQKKYPDISWITTEIHGTNLMIYMKESIDLNDYKKTYDEYASPCNIVAIKDATISDIITRNGTPMIKEGDQVKKGDILINGSILYMDDNGEINGQDNITADGTIYGYTKYTFTKEIDMNQYKKEFTNRHYKKYIVNYKSKNYPIYSKNTPFEYFETTSKENPIGFSSSITFPISITIIDHKEYQPKKIQLSEKEAKDILTKSINEYLFQLRSKGVQIIENNVKITVKEDKLIASGDIKTKELIGIPKMLKYNEYEGDIHGTSREDY